MPSKVALLVTAVLFNTACAAADPDPWVAPPYQWRGKAGWLTLIGVDGRVKEARIAESSGEPKIDAMALAEVKRSWRLTPAKEKEKPVERWGQFKVTFKLTD